MHEKAKLKMLVNLVLGDKHVIRHLRLREQKYHFITCNIVRIWQFLAPGFYWQTKVSFSISLPWLTIETCAQKVSNCHCITSNKIMYILIVFDVSNTK